jgi:SpoVK/Ycf46/Vps4 family AAA+-type ATPase
MAEKTKKVMTEKTKKKETAIPTLNRVTWPDFKRNLKVKRNLSEEHTIDVLIGDPVIHHHLWRNPFARRNIKELARWSKRFPPPVPEPSPVAKMPGDFHPIPDRIRINGEPLKQLLEKVLELEFKPDLPVVLLKPFKLLVQYNDDIRNLYKQLKKKFGLIPADGLDASEDNQGPERRYRGDVAKNEEGNSLLDTYGTDQGYKELGCLIEFMDDDLKGLKHFEDASVTKIPFSELWHIFRPGDEVITAQKPINAYRVLHVTGGRPYLSPPEEKNDDSKSKKSYRLPEKSSDFVVNCYQVDFDGNKFGPVAHSFSIQKYDGLRDITTLLVYPLKFAKNSSEIRETLSANGQTFLDVSRGGHVQYRGLNLHELEEIDSEIVVDFHAALWDSQDKDKNWQFKIDFGIQPPAGANKAEVIMISSDGCSLLNCCENDFVFNDLTLDLKRMEDFLMDKTWLTDVRNLSDDPNDIPREDLILFPYRLFAFVLKDRKWAVVDINNVKKVPEPKDEAWNLLVLPKGHKAMVYSLVQAHFRDRQRVGAEDEMRADLIRGKGKGLIILLHGAPGVGKTSTAECVAELCRRPLYPITCGDLGITAVEVETRLKRIFIQAQKWKCVLLLDEADVFLSERQSDVKHNSLVSVFLRVLEYYQGILFLTTNRVGKIDEAFRSRVHISLYYPPLDRKSTVEIFRANLVRTKTRKGDSLRLKQDEIEEFAEDHFKNNDRRARWNGRQIRNAFHIAIALAENDAAEKARVTKDDKKPPKPTLRAKHFQVVEDASSKFDEYLTTVLGMGHADRAQQNSLRRDNWVEEPKNREKREYKRKAKRYDTSDSSNSEESHAEDSKRSDEPDESDDHSDPPSRRSKSSDDTGSSEDAKPARERKRDAAKKSSRNKDRVSKPKERGKRKG